MRIKFSSEDQILLRVASNNLDYVPPGNQFTVHQTCTALSVVFSKLYDLLNSRNVKINNQCKIQAFLASFYYLL